MESGDVPASDRKLFIDSSTGSYLTQTQTKRIGKLQLPGAVYVNTEKEGSYAIGGVQMDFFKGKLVPLSGLSCGAVLNKEDIGRFPVPLDFGYRADKVWISDILAQDKFNVEGQETHPVFGQVYIVTGRYVTAKNTPKDYPKASVRLWIATKYGWLVVKQETTTADGNRYAYEAQRLEKKGKYWYAADGRSLDLQFRSRKTGTGLKVFHEGCEGSVERGFPQHIFGSSSAGMRSSSNSRVKALHYRGER